MEHAKFAKLSQLFIVAIAVIIISSCDGRRTSSNQEWIDSDSIASAKMDSLEALLDSTMPRGADELFNDFFFNFASNKRLQKERMTLDKSHWTYNSFFMEQGFYTPIFDNEYQLILQNDTNVTKAIVEKIFLKLNSIKQYTFHQIKGYWMLTDIDTMKIDESPNGDFLHFYCKFANDNKFQLQSLNNPVKFIGPDPDNDFDNLEGEILPDTWSAFCPNLPKDYLYNIIYDDKNLSDSNKKMFVINGIANGLEIRMSFERDKNKHWKLIKFEQ